MAHHYRGGDRSQAFLMPPDVREWLPDDHLAWLVVEVVESCDTSAFHVQARRGRQGRPGFDPDVLLALLIYCYANGERSSRQIERLCHTDVACRVITGNDAPDHSVIARFRHGHREPFAELFGQVLALCASQGLGQVGTIALDGTKIDGNASVFANKTRQQLRDEIDQIVAEADAADAAEDVAYGQARGDELPENLAPGPDRAARLRRCLEDLQRDDPTDEQVARQRARVQRLEREIADDEAERERFEADRAAGRRGRNVPREPGVDDPPRPSWIDRKRVRLARARQRLEQLERDDGRDKARRNTTDPDSRLLRSQGQWVQGYNAQAAVSADGLVMACGVTNNPADCTMLGPMLDKLDDTLAAAGITDPVRVVLADAGYHSEDNLMLPGPPRLIPPPDKRAGPATLKMRCRLEQPAMADLYKRRLRVERTFAQIKHNQGIRQFSSRGLPSVEAEWHLICLTHNLRALHRHRSGPDG